jgi:ABC-type transport system substrate-binding protein
LLSPAPQGGANGPADTRLRFTCLVAADDERIGLVVKRQLADLGVEMSVEIAPVEQLRAAMTRHDFEAVLLDVISGPSIFRPYMVWHSRGTLNRGLYASAKVDAALEQIQHSTDDESYRTGVALFQQSILDDPPAIFLAWTERARAVSSRFDVRGAEPDTDILGTLRLWRSFTGGGRSTTN